MKIHRHRFAAILMFAAACCFRAAGATSPAVDTGTLTGKVMCGYQGWFNCEGDGAERGWVHWTKRRGALRPGNAKVDLWPDVSELGPDERFATEFTNANGRPAEVFSSFKPATVFRHFEWMRDYGIDGAFVQRFIVDVQSPKGLRHNNTVLNHCREGAKRAGRTFVVMYDLSGLGSNRMAQVSNDWRTLRQERRVADDAAYLHRDLGIRVGHRLARADRAAQLLGDRPHLVIERVGGDEGGDQGEDEGEDEGEEEGEGNPSPPLRRRPSPLRGRGCKPHPNPTRFCETDH